jgi:zinc/manganese transport system permease protein
MLALLLDAGFFQSGPVRGALVVGAVVAVVSGAVGVVTVLRGQSFAGHALGDVGTMGGSGAYLAGVNPLWGFVGVGVAVAATMELFGVQRRRGRDVATGVVLGAALGISALLLYLDSVRTSTTGATVTILFGSLFTVGSSTVPAAVALGAVGLLTLGVLYRPLLLSSVSSELAAARGIPVKVLGVTFLVLMGVAVSLSAIAVGAVLSTALLVGPAATALRLTSRPVPAMLLAGGLGLATTWIGIVLAYDSYYWPPAGKGWPVSFFVVTLVFLGYVAVDAGGRVVARRRRRLARPQAEG